jgi:hypothetical protein
VDGQQSGDEGEQQRCGCQRPDEPGQLDEQGADQVRWWAERDAAVAAAWAAPGTVDVVDDLSIFY